MKSKKNKRDHLSTPRSSEEDLTLRSNNAFTFIKNRFFHTTPSIHLSASSTSTNSPRPSTSSTLSKPWSIEHQATDQTTMSRSFDETPLFDNNKPKNTRPMSMMGMDTLLQDFTIPIAPITRRNSNSKRTSLIVIKEGYLFKKTDFKPFHKQHNRGSWKLYRVELRGHKLYLYKLTSESPLRSLFPQQQVSQLSFSSMQSKTEYDAEAQQVFFSPTANMYNAIVTEVNQATLQAMNKVNLVLTTNDGYLYICSDHHGQWILGSKIAASEIQVDILQDDPSLVFSLSYIQRPATVGVYQTNKESGQAWISMFNSISAKLGEEVSSSNNTNFDDSMYDATQRYHPELMRNHRSEIKGGSINALVHESVYNHDVLLVLLTTYSVFTTGSRLLLQYKWILDKNPALQKKILEIFVTWCEQCSVDIMGDVATSMMAMLEGLAGQEVQKVKELVLSTVSENTNKVTDKLIISNETQPEEEEEESSGNENIKSIRRDSINLSNLLISGLTQDIFLLIDPRSFAQQIYLFHHSKHQQFQNELLMPSSYLPRPQLSIQMLNSLLFTTSSPHFLTKLIRNQILVDSTLFSRSRFLEHWINIGCQLMALGDMTGWCAIAMGLCSVGIVRLRETWKAVDRELVRCVQQEWATLLTDYGLFSQDIWMHDGYQQSKVLDIRDLDLPFTLSPLPFFGTIRQSVDRTRKHVQKSLGPNMINFEECSSIYSIITTSLDQYKALKAVVDVKSVGPVVVGPLQSYFEHSVTDTMSVPHDYKYLQECSLTCEPRILCQKGCGNNQQQTVDRVAPPSSSSLVFPNLLDHCTLFDVDHLGSSNVSSASSTTSLSSTSSFKKPSTSRNKLTSQSSIRSFLEENVETTPTKPRKPPCHRRTYSFPPPGSSEQMIEENSRTWLGSLISNRHHRTYSTKALIEAHQKNQKALYGHNGEIILRQGDGELVYKVVALLKKEEAAQSNALKKTESLHSIDFLKKDDYQEDQLLVCIKAGDLEHLIDALVHGTDEATLKDQWQMMSFAEGLQHQPQPSKITMDEQEYIQVFFSTFRIYCSSVHLLDLLRKTFAQAQSQSRKRKNSLIMLESYFASTKQDETEYEWDAIAQVQLRVLNLVMYWLQSYPYDFVDEIEIARHVEQFFVQAKQRLEEWRAPLKQQDEQHEALKVAASIDERLCDLRTQFIRVSLSPSYDMKSLAFDPESCRGAQELYNVLTEGSQRYYATLQLATNNRVPLSISSKPRDIDAKSLVDRFTPEVLLEQTDKVVRQLLSAVTMQDWIQTSDVFEAQAADLYAWLPARKPSRTSRMSSTLAPVAEAPTSHVNHYQVLTEEVVISDIFTAIEGARRSIVSPSAFSDDDLFLAFPSSIQYLYCMHFIIRSWVMNEIAATDVDSKTRVLRIDKFLQIVLLSKVINQKMTLFSDLKDGHRVPGFVEYAIASALVSPEVRLFAKAWQDIAMQYGHAHLDTLENLLNQIQKTQSTVSRNRPVPFSTAASSSSSLSQLTTMTSSAANTLVVPSLGWIFERIMELCFHIPDKFDLTKELIHFDKRRCMFQFLQLVMNAQADLEEQPIETKISMSFLVSPNQCSHTWKDLKELAMRENKKMSSLVLKGPSSKSSTRSTVFHKLVTEQLDKLKRDFKDRDRIDKEWLVLQHKLQKKQVEQAKLVEKRGTNKSTTHQHLSTAQRMPRINSFFRGLRPYSVSVSTHLPDMAPLTTTKASTVINLIHSTTSIASTYTKRDFVFRIVTEEGGQYLFQAINRDDMHEWMQHINNAAREGAAKRQSVLASELHQDDLHVVIQSRPEPPCRTSVYGVSLDMLMRDGQVPLVAEKCIEEIERRGLEEVGIYRVAGTGSVVSALKAEFNKDVNKVDLSSQAWADINVVADAFKQFLRELPEPLLTYTFYDEFIRASASEDHDERVYLIKKVIKKLPYSNYILLKRIIEHFVIVTDFEAINHMYATNLAIVFGPTLLQPTPGPASFATTMSNLGHHQNIVKYLILNYHYLFDVECDEVDKEDTSSK